jgi:hypothetical protein
MIKNKYPLKKDLIISIILTLLLATLTLMFKTNIFNFNPKELLIALLGLNGALLGFIITAITILFMFDYTKSEILTKIKEKGFYNQIFERYTSTSIVLIVSLVYFLILLIAYNFQGFRFLDTFIIFNLQIQISVILVAISNLVLVCLLSLSLIRIFRSIKLLKLIFENLD